MTMSKKAQAIAKRYDKGFVTDEQLERYLDFGVLTDEEYATIYETKHPKQENDVDAEAEAAAE